MYKQYMTMLFIFLLLNSVPFRTDLQQPIMNSQELRPFTVTVGKYNITVVPENISVQIKYNCPWALNSAEVRSFIDKYKPFWLFSGAALGPELNFDNKTKYYALIKFNISEFWQLNVWRELNETTENYTIKTKLFSNANETKFNIRNILLASVTYLDENDYNFTNIGNLVLTALPQFSPVILTIMGNACYGYLIYLSLNGTIVDFDVTKLSCYNGSWQKRWLMFIGNLIFFSMVFGPVFLVISLIYIIHRYSKKKTKNNRTNNMA